MQLQRAFGFDLLPDPAFCSWFAGFVDGEGCFKAGVAYRRQSMRKVYFYTRLSIALRDDDLPVLREIEQTLSIGRIIPKRARNTSNAQAEYTIYRTDDCYYVVVPLFEKYPLRAKKRKDFEIWKQCVILRHQYPNLEWLSLSRRQTFFDEFQELCLKLKNGRQYQENGEHDGTHHLSPRP